MIREEEEEEEEGGGGERKGKERKGKEKEGKDKKSKNKCRWCLLHKLRCCLHSILLSCCVHKEKGNGGEMKVRNTVTEKIPGGGGKR